MKDILVFGLVGGAAWFIWQAMANAQTTSTTPATGGTSPTTPTAPALNTALVNQLNNAMPGYWNPQAGQPATFNGSATVSQWNWILNNVVSKGSSTPSLPFSVNQMITAAQYVAALQSAGLAGYRRRSWRVA